jgi:hypothetical protein
LKVGPVGCPKTSVRNYRHTPRNSLEERSSHLLRRVSLKSHKKLPAFMESQRSFPRAQNTAILHVLNPRTSKTKSEMSHILRYMDTQQVCQF